MFITVKTRRRKMRKNTHLPRKGQEHLDCIGHLFVSINVGDLSMHTTLQSMIVYAKISKQRF